MEKRQTFLAKTLGFCRQLMGDRRGGVIVYTAILLPALIGFVGLGVDVALWHVTKRQTQIMADAAAIGGALEIMRVETNPDVTGAAMTDAVRNGFDAVDGDQITINNPPSAGSITVDDDAVEVIVRVRSPKFLSSVIDSEERWISSRAVGLGETNNTCLWSLEPSAPAAIKVAGGSNVEFTCGVFSNSSDAEAITLAGTGSCLTGSEIKVVGDVSSGCLTPFPETGVTPLSDPLSTLPPPPSTGCTYSGNTNVTGSSDATLSPGTYCGNISILTTGTVTFNPGIYYMDSAGINIGAGATVVGSGVTIYMAPGGQVSDNISVNSGATVALEAPLSGTYAGILIYQDKDSDPNITLNLTGGAYMDLSGIVYAPNQEVLFSGGSAANSSNSTIISNTISFSGNSNIAEYTPSVRLTNPLLVEARLVE